MPQSERGRKLLGVSVAVTLLAAFAVAARLFTRIRLVRKTGLDDWLILTSLLLSSVHTGFVIGEIQYGLGKHQADLALPELETQLKLIWFSIPYMHASLGCTKCSIILLYRRVFPSKGMRTTCNIILAFLVGWYLWAVLSAILTCIPVAKFWDPTLPGHCFNFTALWFSNASVNILTDLTLVILPIPLISSLLLPRRQKLVLWAIFATGGFVCITSILRLKSLLVFSVSKDPSWDNIPVAIWTYVECNLAIVCACLTCLRPLVSRIAPHLLSSDDQSPVGLVDRRFLSDPSTTT